MGPSPGDLKDGGPQSISPASFAPRVPFSLGGLPGDDSDFGEDIISSPLLFCGSL